MLPDPEPPDGSAAAAARGDTGMDPKRTRRTISAPLVRMALAVALILAVPAAASSAGPATAWTRQFGTSKDDCALAIAFDSRDRILVAGQTSGTFAGQTNQGGRDAFVRTFRH